MPRPRVRPPMRSACAALAIVMGLSSAARADGRARAADTGFFLVDLFVNLLALGLETAAIEDAAMHTPPPPPEPALAQRYGDDDPPRSYWRRRREPQARQGLLISFGVGGGSLYVSNQGRERTGA